MGEAEPPLHFLFVSFPGQGHVNPLLRLAKRVASKGPLVTFSTTSDFGSRIHSPSPTTTDLIPIGLGFLRFEFFPLAPNPPNLLSNPTLLLSNLMSNLDSNGPQALTTLILNQSSPVSCLINNPFIPWALDVASQLSIPSAVLWIQSSAVFSIYYHFNHHQTLEPVIKGLPPLASHELPTFLLPSNPYKSLTKAILAQFGNIVKARWVFANSFFELEEDTFRALGDVVSVVPVGPLVDVGEEGGEEKVKADLWESADYCIDWLETKENNSVVYVSVGSVVMLSGDEMAELAFGLRSSGRPFLWVVRNYLFPLYEIMFKNIDIEDLHACHTFLFI